LTLFRRQGTALAALLAAYVISASGGLSQAPAPEKAAGQPENTEAAPNRAKEPEPAAPNPAPEAAPPRTAVPETAPARKGAPEAPPKRTQAEPAPAGRNPLAESPFAEVFALLAGRVSTVVVNISTTQALPAPPAKTPPEGQQNSPGSSLDDFFRDFFGERGAPGGSGPRAASLGSGFIVDASGLIVTNNHVIANAEQITVTLSDDTAMQAQVVGRDAVTDLALLKVEPKAPLPAAVWGDSTKVRVGDWVLAIGNPFGLGGSVTSGIISATARDIRNGPYDEYLQTDASINRGNSGGPMFNLNGEVIGINTMIYSPSGGSIGIGFAVPATLAQRIVEQLRTTGKVERGWFGARIQPVTDEIADSVGLDKGRGAMIASIDPGSPAAQAKLQPGDVIIGYEGKPIERSRQLPRLVAETPPDKTVKLSVWRDGKEGEIDVKIAALNPNRPAPPPPEPEKPKPPPTVDALGLKFTKLSPELRKQFGISDAARGVVIVEVAAERPRGAAGPAPRRSRRRGGRCTARRSGRDAAARGRGAQGRPQAPAAARRARRQHPLYRLAARPRLTRGRTPDPRVEPARARVTLRGRSRFGARSPPPRPAARPRSGCGRASRSAPTYCPRRSTARRG